MSKMDFPALIGGEKPSQIKRKPVVVPAQAYIPSKEIFVDIKEIQYRHDTATTIDTLPAHPASRSYHHIPSSIDRIRARWSSLSRRIRIITLAVVLILFILAIGLSAGLSHKSRTTNLPLPTNHGGPYSGDLTYYDPGLGACGMTNSGTDSICAVSHLIFDAASTSSNPNANPLCGTKIRIRRDGKSVDLTVVDRCTGCKATDIDTTRDVFGDVAWIDAGRVNVDWSWLEDVPGGTMAQ